jgi:hypothetical protein
MKRIVPNPAKKKNFFPWCRHVAFREKQKILSDGGKSNSLACFPGAGHYL